MMEYWKGYMDWPLKKGWVCETCNENKGLTWGLIHAECRCNQCHTQYYMRDKNQKAVEIPISLLKEEYKAPAKAGWKVYQVPISQWNDAMWDESFKKAEENDSHKP